MKKKGRKTHWLPNRPRAEPETNNPPILTCVLSFLILVAFIATSNNRFFSSEDLLHIMGVSLATPWNIIIYPFAHTGYAHILSNLAVLIAAGAIIERALGKKDLLLLFFFGSFFSAIGFLMITPGYAIVGASAGAISLMSAAFILEPKELLRNVIILAIVSMALVYGIGHLAESRQQEAVAETQKLGQEKAMAIEQNNFVAVQKVEKQIEEKRMEIAQMEEGKRVAETDPNFEIHLFAALFAIIYLFIFSCTVIIIILILSATLIS